MRNLLVALLLSPLTLFSGLGWAQPSGAAMSSLDGRFNMNVSCLTNELAKDAKDKGFSWRSDLQIKNGLYRGMTAVMREDTGRMNNNDVMVATQDNGKIQIIIDAYTSDYKLSEYRFQGDVKGGRAELSGGMFVSTPKNVSLFDLRARACTAVLTRSGDNPANVPEAAVARQVPTPAVAPRAPAPAVEQGHAAVALPASVAPAAAGDHAPTEPAKAADHAPSPAVASDEHAPAVAPAAAPATAPAEADAGHGANDGHDKAHAEQGHAQGHEASTTKSDDHGAAGGGFITRYFNLLLGLLIAVVTALVGLVGYLFFKKRQAAKAEALQDAVESEEEAVAEEEEAVAEEEEAVAEEEEAVAEEEEAVAEEEEAVAEEEEAVAEEEEAVAEEEEAVTGEEEGLANLPEPPLLDEPIDAPKRVKEEATDKPWTY